jgi:hypothetical protein
MVRTQDIPDTANRPQFLEPESLLLEPGSDFKKTLSKNIEGKFR